MQVGCYYYCCFYNGNFFTILVCRWNAVIDLTKERIIPPIARLQQTRKLVRIYSVRRRVSFSVCVASLEARSITAVGIRDRRPFWRIISFATKGRTSQQSPCSQNRTLTGPKFFNRLNAVLRTGRQKSAGGRQQRTNEILVDTNGGDHGSRNGLFLFWFFLAILISSAILLFDSQSTC